MFTGRIESFDERRGDGTLLGDDSRRYWFHCVSIADGSRTLTVGARASAERRVGLVGHDEVVAVKTLDDDQ